VPCRTLNNQRFELMNLPNVKAEGNRMARCLAAVMPGKNCGVDTMRRVLSRLIFAPSLPVRAQIHIQGVAQRLMGGPRLETVRLADGHLFDCLTSEQYWWTRDSYEDDERRELVAYLKPDSILFDVGAHAGFWEVILASRCRHVYAFEPSPRNFDRLSRNIAQNRIQNVTAVAAAVSDETARVSFLENGSMSHLGEKGIEVNAIQLDEYAAQHEPPTVVKIDIEGHAGAALRGMRHTLSQYKPVLFIELHDADEDAACHAVVDDLGYKFAPVGSKGGFPHRCRTAAD
jgi:FkbM family methyltransferase